MAEREFSSLRARLRPPALPDHDVADPVESSVIRALTRSWGIRATVKKTFAIGVPSGALMCRPPFSCPPALPARNSGQRLWLCTLGLPIGDP